MQSLFLIVLIPIYFFATNLNATLESNPNIRQLTQDIKIKEYETLNAELYKNPIFSIGLTNIQSLNPRKRDIEPTQTNFITLSQEITNHIKLKLQKEISKFNEINSRFFVQDMKNKLIRNIDEYLSIIHNEKIIIQLQKEKIENIQKIQNYHNIHIKSAIAFQQSIQNDYMLEQLKMKIAISKEHIIQQEIKLEEILGPKFRDIIQTRSIEKLTFIDNIESINEHLLLQIQKNLLQQSLKQSSLNKEEKTPNLTINTGYYNRDSFHDFINISVKIPLTLYGREENTYARSKVKIRGMQDKIQILKDTLYKEFKLALSEYRSSQKAIFYLKNIIQSIQKEIKLLNNQNIKDSVLKILSLENNILEYKIQLEQYVLKSRLATLNLKYLSSDIKE